MAQNSKIEWTHHTANLWHGCTAVHEGCDNCYATSFIHCKGVMGVGTLSSILIFAPNNFKIKTTKS